MSSHKPLTAQQRAIKAVRDGVRREKRMATLIKTPKSESEYEEYYDEEGESNNSIDKEEEEYLEFLEAWGHVDFTMLLLLPQIRTVEELQEIRDQNVMNTTRAIRTKVLIGSNPKVVRKDKRKKKGEEEERERELPLYEKQYKKHQENQGSRAGLDGDAEAKLGGLTLGIKDQSPDEIADRLGPIKAERFDFTMNEHFYAAEIVVDAFGERLTATTDLQGRVVSKEGIHKDEATGDSDADEEWDDERQEWVPVLDYVKPVIPIKELVHVYYFQWRIDRLNFPQEFKDAEDSDRNHKKYRNEEYEMVEN
jgi:hypothetical protein